MPRLEVHQLSDDDVYKDIIRVNAAHRKNEKGETIKEGRVILVRGNGGKCFAVVRGYQASAEPRIYMDEYTRTEKFDVQYSQTYEFAFKPVGLVGQLRWAWNATEMGYQVASRLAVLGFIMGVLGLMLGIATLLDWPKWTAFWRCVCGFVRLLGRFVL